MTFRCFIATAVAVVPLAKAHSYVTVLGGGEMRGGLNQANDEDRAWLYCDSGDLSTCQPPANTGETLTAANLRPCKSAPSPTWGSGSAGQPIHIEWVSKGHDNSQSDGTCVSVAIAPYSADPDRSTFRQLESCLPFFTAGRSPNTQADVTLPGDLAAGDYTVFWKWPFAGFVYTSCVDIHVGGGGGSAPAAAAAAPAAPAQAAAEEPADHTHAAVEEPADHTHAAPAAASPTAADAAPSSGSALDQYKSDGCGNLVGSFCATQFDGSYCQNSANADPCGRWLCHGQSYSDLKPCGSRLLI